MRLFYVTVLRFNSPAEPAFGKRDSKNEIRPRQSDSENEIQKTENEIQKTKNGIWKTGFGPDSRIQVGVDSQIRKTGFRFLIHLTDNSAF